MVLSLVVQLSLAFGVAGLLWPEKLVAVFDVLMFPWPATPKFVRVNAWGALLVAVFLFLALVGKVHVRVAPPAAAHGGERTGGRCRDRTRPPTLLDCRNRWRWRCGSW